MKKLYYIHFTPTHTYFLVCEENKEKALNTAMEANHQVGEMADIDMDQKELYAIEQIDSFEKLVPFFKRNDYYMELENTIIFDS